MQRSTDKSDDMPPDVYLQIAISRHLYDIIDLEWKADQRFRKFFRDAFEIGFVVRAKAHYAGASHAFIQRKAGYLRELVEVGFRRRVELDLGGYFDLVLIPAFDADRAVRAAGFEAGAGDDRASEAGGVPVGLRLQIRAAVDGRGAARLAGDEDELDARGDERRVVRRHLGRGW